MNIEISSLSQMSDADLLSQLRRVVSEERRTTTQLIAVLMEVDGRRLYLAEGCASLFVYCTQVLHLTEHAAYGRIEAARAARRFPVILERLIDGTLCLTAVCLLAPHLTPANHLDLLNAARHKSKREIEQLVAQINPRPDVRSKVRKLPAPRPVTVVDPPRVQGTPEAELTAPAAPTVVSSRAAEVKPLAPERYKIQFTVSRETYDKLRQAQDLLRHSIPNGDPAAIFDKAMTLLLKELSKTKLGAADRPRLARKPANKSRHIPAAVKRAVWQRDGGRCAFEGALGRCSERGFLEFHHVVPYAAEGEATAANIQLRCRAHNRYEADQFFGSSPPLYVRERDCYGMSTGNSARTESQFLPNET